MKINLDIKLSLLHLKDKNEIFKFRSVKSIVIALAKTSKDKRKIAVIKIDYTNKGILSRDKCCL